MYQELSTQAHSAPIDRGHLGQVTCWGGGRGGREGGGGGRFIKMWVQVRFGGR